MIYYYYVLQSEQNVLLSPPHLDAFVSHLPEPWIATSTQTIAAAATVLRTSASPVSLTQLLEPDYGSQLSALQKVVAVKVIVVMTI